MGEVSIDLTVLDRDPVYEGWHTLTDKNGEMGAVSGDVHIIVDSRPGAEERFKEVPKKAVRYKAGEVKRNTRPCFWSFATTSPCASGRAERRTSLSTNSS